MFEDRKAAGRQIAELLKRQNYRPDVVISCSLKGLEVAEPVAEAMDAGIRLKLAEEIRVPGRDLVFGAVAEDGTMWVDDSLRNEFDVSPDYLRRTRTLKSYSLKMTSRAYRGDFGDLRGRNILVVEDGISEGFRAGAVAGSILKEGGRNLALAAPVISNSRRVELADLFNRIFYLEKTGFLADVDQCYRA